MRGWSPPGLWLRVDRIPWAPDRVDGGTNFSVWSRTASQIDLLLFDDVDDARPSRTIPLDPHRNRTAAFWHVLVPDVGPGQLYAWRVHGAFDPSAGLRHDASALLLDPYGVARGGADAL